MFFHFSTGLDLDVSQHDALERAARAAGLPEDATLSVSHSQRSDQVTALTLHPQAGYPGVAPALALYRGELYGAILGRGLGALASAMGWFETPPTAGAAFELYVLVEHAGGLYLDSDAQPELEVSRGQLLLRADVRAPFDHVGSRHSVELRPHRSAVVVVEPLVRAPAAAVPIDAVTGWIRSVETGALDSVASVRALAASSDPRAGAVVLRATARPEEAIWVEALAGLDLTVPSVTAGLVAAWSTLTDSARAQRVEVARELFGTVPDELLGAGEQ